jgi:hypothetical protein
MKKIIDLKNKMELIAGILEYSAVEELGMHEVDMY